jgi:hypothetical protein
MGEVMLAEKDLFLGDPQPLLNEILHPELFREPAHRGLLKDPLGARKRLQN